MNMIKRLIFVWVLTGFTSCSYYVISPKVKERKEIRYAYKKNKKYKLNKWKREKQNVEYIKYDREGNVIEDGLYGESWCHSEAMKKPDSTIAIVAMDFKDYRKLNTVEYYKYDSSGKKIEDITWIFKNNKKNRLMDSVIYTYTLDGKLKREMSYDVYNDLVSTVYPSDNNKKSDNFPKEIAVSDTTGNMISTTYYYNGKFSYREKVITDSMMRIITQLRYDDKPDSLSAITEWRYDFEWHPQRKFLKWIGSTYEITSKYVYNRKKLLKKILYYDNETLSGYTKYNYRLY